MTERTEIIKAERGNLIHQVESMFFDVAAFEHLQRVSQMFATSKMVPEQFRGNVADCIIALNLSHRLRLDPFMMMQSMYVVHGRPGIEGKLRIALLNGSGRYSPLKFRMETSGKKTSKGVSRPDACTAYATELSSGEELSVSVSWETVQAEGWDAKPGSKWLTMPEQMFRYRSAAFFERAYCPEVSLGLRDVEELADIVDVTPQPDGTYSVTPQPQEPPTKGVAGLMARLENGGSKPEMPQEAVQNRARAAEGETRRQEPAQASQNEPATKEEPEDSLDDERVQILTDLAKKSGTSKMALRTKLMEVTGKQRVHVRTMTEDQFQAVCAWMSGPIQMPVMDMIQPNAETPDRRKEIADLLEYSGQGWAEVDRYIEIRRCASLELMSAGAYEGLKVWLEGQGNREIGADPEQAEGPLGEV